MLQVVQSIKGGRTTVCELPDPVVQPEALLVANVASLVSAGTEKYVIELAQKNLLQKARARPDHVRRVLQKLRQEGLVSTLTQVRAKLAEQMPLGYSGAGVVVACGDGVQAFKPGDRVAHAGPHAALVNIGQRLCATVPPPVTFEQAAYTSVAAIALEGVRLARVSLGDRVLVIGLGLIGQIGVCLLKAQGCRVFGTDLDPARVEAARALGADLATTGAPLDEVTRFAGGHGVDAVLITAATSSNEPIAFAADAARPKGRVVLVGVAGLELPREPFFKKELEFTVSASLGPGRWDPRYEEQGQDYPIGHARWTAQRNMQAVLETMAAGQLPVERLTTHRFAIDRAEAAYALITASAQPYTGIVLTYPEPPQRLNHRLHLSGRALGPGQLGVSLIGAGNFTRLVMLPILRRLERTSWRGLCTAKGLNAVVSGRSMGFAFATTDAGEVIGDEQTRVVLIMTRHDLHAGLVVAALRAGKHVFVEKPLCITAEELGQIAACVEELGDDCPLLMVGFNRRFAPATGMLRQFFAGSDPLSLSFRFVAGELPPESWPQDRAVGGGRIIGEACHAIDTCAAIAGSPPVRVFAESVVQGDRLATSDDRVLITLRHENGSIASVSYQAGGDRAGPKERIEVFGGGRTGIVEDWDAVDLWQRNRRSRRQGGKNKGHAEEIEAFFSAVRRGGPWPIPWPELYGTTWASLMAVRSLREGRPIDASSEG